MKQNIHFCTKNEINNKNVSFQILKIFKMLVFNQLNVLIGLVTSLFSCALPPCYKPMNLSFHGSSGFLNLRVSKSSTYKSAECLIHL